MKDWLRHFLIICLFLISGFVCLAYAQTPIQEQLTRVEKELWGISYGNESDSIRLDRIEKQVFGTANNKTTAEKRIEKISKSLGIETYKEAQSSLTDLYVSEQPGEGVEYPQIDNLEKVLLGSVYKNENIYKRLERLEKKAFGTKQSGELNERTEALKRHAKIADNYDVQPQAQPMPRRQQNIQTYNYSSDESDIRIQISAIENMVFGMDYSSESTPVRLSRLENRVFQRGFNEDDDATRVARLQAAATAKRTSKYYDNNKFQKYTSTGFQAASLILMILALIL